MTFHPKTTNWCGPFGLWISAISIKWFGLSAFLIPLLLFLFGIYLIKYKSYPIWVRYIGALLFLPSVSTFLSTIIPTLELFGGRLYSGGLLGHKISTWLTNKLSWTGMLLLLAIFILSGFCLAGNVIMKNILKGIFLVPIRIVRSVISYLQKKKVAIRAESSAHEKKRKIKIKRGMESEEIVSKEPAIEQEKLPFMGIEAFKLPSLDYLESPKTHSSGISPGELEHNSRLLEKKLGDFNIQGKVVEVQPGPVITVYEFEPAPGMKISRITNLADDLAMAMRALSIRIVAPIPGKSVVGIEIPNKIRETVYLKDILRHRSYQNSHSKLTMGLGKDIMGTPVITDLSNMPHLLIAGATGSGKSVALNSMILSILFKARPSEVKFILIDPKRIEMAFYEDIPHLLYPVVNDPKEATQVLKWAVMEMEKRYQLLALKGARNITSFNKRVAKKKSPQVELPKTLPLGITEDELHSPLPYLVIVIDELADLMLVSSREVETSLTRLSQMARAAGIHLLVATQRPSVDVLTGIIKANFPTRISFQVSSKVDSRTILDTNGAETLLGKGDMLFLPPGVSKLVRIHGAYVSDKEIERVTNFLKSQAKPEYQKELISQYEDSITSIDNKEKDEKYEEAVAYVRKVGKVSVSMLQRRFRIGYNRAARIVEMMEEEGIVSSADGPKPRQVIG